MTGYLDMKTAADFYVQWHLPIIPVCSWDHSGMTQQHTDRCKTPGKAPIIQDWSKRTHTLPSEVEEWFQRWPTINVGLVLGECDAHGQIIGIDIDGAEGEKIFQQFTSSREVPQTWEFTTGSGRRLLYKVPAALKTRKNKFYWSEGHEEVAFLAQGQQTVLPPSNHPSGRVYTWVPGKSPMQIDLAMAPEWMQAMVEDTGPAAQAGPTYTEDDAERINREGGRSNALVRYVGHLCKTTKMPLKDLIQAAHIHNYNFNQPPLPDGEVEKMVSSVFRSEKAKRVAAEKAKKQREEKKDNWTPAALALQFMKDQMTLGRYFMYYKDKGQFLMTTVGDIGWKPIDGTTLESLIMETLQGIDSTFAAPRKTAEARKSLEMLYSNRNLVDSTENHLAIFQGREPEEFEQPVLEFTPDPCVETVATLDGVFIAKTGELRKWDPLVDRHTVIINAHTVIDDNNREAVENARDMWDKALRTWVPDEDAVLYLQEYIGYALTMETKYRAFTLLYGGGANGKSLFLEIVKSLFAGCSHSTTLERISDRFETAYLENKLLVECSDMEKLYNVKTGVVKQVVSGESIHAEIKGGKSYNFTPFCKLLFSANNLPHSADKTDGWYSRIKIVPFPNRFKPDKNFYNTMMATMTSDAGRTALFHWAYEGLQRLEAQDAFTVGQSMLDSEKEYKRDNDAVIEFYDDLLEIHPLAERSYKNSLLLTGVYEVYKSWCEQTGTKCCRMKTFVESIKKEREVAYLRFKNMKGEWISRKAVVACQFNEYAEEQYIATYHNICRTQEKVNTQLEQAN